MADAWTSVCSCGRWVGFADTREQAERMAAIHTQEQGAAGHEVTVVEAPGGKKPRQESIPFRSDMGPPR